jgi:putative NADH-flavin reductase
VKTIVVLGATGPTGRHVVRQALAQGHRVTAFVRNPDKLPLRDQRLRVATGSVPDDAEAVAEAVREADAVISALGVGQSFRPRGLMARSAPVIVSAMERHGVRRLIFLSAIGVGDTIRDTPLPLRIFSRTLLRAVYADKQAADDRVRASGLDWTLVHPVMLSDGEGTGRWRAGERLDLRGAPKIPRADVASFILAQLNDPTYLRKSVVLSS